MTRPEIALAFAFLAIPAFATIAPAGQITAFATNLDGSFGPDLTKPTVLIRRHLVGTGIQTETVPDALVGFAVVTHPVTKQKVHKITVTLDETGVNPAFLNCTVTIQSFLRKVATLDNLNIRGQHQVDIIMPKEEVAFVPSYFVLMCPPSARTRSHGLGSLFHKR